MAKKPLNDRLKLASILEAYKPIMEQDRVNQIPKLFREATIDVKAAEEKKWREEAKSPTTLKDKVDPKELKKEAFDAFIPKMLAAGASPKAISNVLGNIKAESSFDYTRRENMSYSTPKAMRNAFPVESKKYTDEQLVQLAKDPYDLAKAMYGSEERAQRDASWNDPSAARGSKYRGTGYVQLSTPGGYKKATQYLRDKGINDADLYNDPTILRQRPDIAAEIALWKIGGSKNPNKFENINNVFKAIRFSGYDQEGGEEQKRRMQYAQELQPEVEAYIKQYQSKQKSGGTTKKPKINLIKALTEN